MLVSKGAVFKHEALPLNKPPHKFEQYQDINLVRYRFLEIVRILPMKKQVLYEQDGESATHLTPDSGLILSILPIQRCNNISGL